MTYFSVWDRCGQCNEMLRIDAKNGLNGYFDGCQIIELKMSREEIKR
jgi:hypothetical protein